MKRAKVYSLLETGNFQAKALQDFTVIKKGQDVNLKLRNGYVHVSDTDGEYLEQMNLDAQSDYDKYFKIY